MQTLAVYKRQKVSCRIPTVILYFSFSLCHRWIPRGWQDNKIPEYQEDEIVEVCDSYYAPQYTDKCKCDESLECDEDLSSSVSLREVFLFV